MNNMKTFRLLMMLAAILLLANVAQPGYGQKDIVVRKPSTTQKSGATTTKKSTTTTTKKTTTTNKSSGTAKKSSGTSSTGQQQRKISQVFTVDGIQFKMICVEGGTFIMGPTSEQVSDAYSDEGPVHQVTLSSYYIGETEVTQELWQAVMGNNPSEFKGSHRPIENVSWEDCQDFIRHLNQKTGKDFRLPTEAEWEFAARGGRKSNGYKYAGGNSIDDVAWYEGNSNYETHNVGTKRANELGIYDMSGNVYEWCQDWDGSYSSSSQTNPTGPSKGSFRVERGGCWDKWFGLARDCRVSHRTASTPSACRGSLGLRLACSAL